MLNPDSLGGSLGFRRNYHCASLHRLLLNSQLSNGDAPRNAAAVALDDLLEKAKHDHANAAGPILFLGIIRRNPHLRRTKRPKAKCGRLRKRVLQQSETQP